MGTKIERKVGSLKSFDHSPGSSHGYARFKDDLIHLPTWARGVLEGETIRPCNRDERYEKIPPGTAIVADVNFRADGSSPIPVAWAPKKVSKNS